MNLKIGSKKSKPMCNCKNIIDQQTFLLWINKLEKSSFFAFHIKTNIKKNYELIGLSIAINIGESAYLSLLSNDIETLLQLNLEKVFFYLKPILESNKIKKIGQDLKFYYRILKLYKIDLSGLYFDIQIACYVINSFKNNSKTFVEDWLSKLEKKNKFSNNSAAKQDEPDLLQESEIILKIYFKISEEFKSDLLIKNLFEKIEMPLLTVLSHMESNGVRIDADYLESYSYELADRIRYLENVAYKIVGEYFNLGSPKQLQNILFKKHRIPSFLKTSSGFLSTNEKVLAKMSRNFPLPKIVLEYRSLAKFKNSYTDKLPQLINPITGRVHSFYHQTFTTTGRISSTTPNLQNIPIRKPEGRKIRKAFIPPSKEYRIVSADYSQIELRILAHLSQDEKLLNCFNNQEDIHSFTASEIFGIKRCQVSASQRRQAKIINFGVIYGMSAFGLSHQINISIKAAQTYINRYFQQYNGILTYINKTKTNAKEHGYVTTITGRKIYIPDIYSSNKISENAALRSAINAPIQGTAADIIKLAMINLDDWINKNYFYKNIKMIMQVHDELVFEVKNSILEQAIITIRHFMENSISLKIPLNVNIGVGNNWEEAH